jgi:trimeric autotransporter adhesin
VLSAVGSRRQRAGVLLAVLGILAAGAVGDATAAVKSVPDQTWQTDGRVRAVAYSGGVVYIGGSFTRVRPPGSSTSSVVRNHAAAFDAATGALLPWNPNANGAVHALAVSNSTIYLGGSFTSVGGTSRPRVASVTKAGAVTDWNPRANGTIHEILLDGDGRLYLGGQFTTVGGQSRLRLARVGPTGAVQAWKANVTQVSGTCPPHCSPIVFALGLSGDGGTLYTGGRFEVVNGVSRKGAAAVATETGATLAWNPNVVTPNPKKAAQVGRVLDMAVGGTRVYLCGDFWSVGGHVSANLAAVETVTGARVGAFNANTDGGSPACELKDGLVYVGGHFGLVGPPSGWVFVPGQKATLTGGGTAKRAHIAAFDAGTGAISPWNPGANSTLGVHALASDAARLGVGGDFTRIGGKAQQGFAQFSN